MTKQPQGLTALLSDEELKILKHHDPHTQIGFDQEAFLFVQDSLTEKLQALYDINKFGKLMNRYASVQYRCRVRYCFLTGLIKICGHYFTVVIQRHSDGWRESLMAHTSNLTFGALDEFGVDAFLIGEDTSPKVHVMLSRYREFPFGGSEAPPSFGDAIGVCHHAFVNEPFGYSIDKIGRAQSLKNRTYLI